MAKPKADFGSLPFDEQTAFFRRKLNLPTRAWTDIYGAEHDRAFVVAGAAKMDLLQDFRGAVDKAITNGETLRDFRKRFDTIVADHGWTYNGGRNWRSRVIYETNLRTSYMAGRHTQMQAIKHRRPYWRYVHQDGELHPRPWHQAWNGIVLHADDPWWDGHFPPGGWYCKCTVDTLSQSDLDDMGKTGPDTAPDSDPQTVTIGKNGPSPRTVTTLKGIDPGFGHVQGKTSLGAATERLVRKSAVLAPKVSAAAIGTALSKPRILKSFTSQFSSWAQRVGKGKSKNNYFAAGVISEPLIDKLKLHHQKVTAAPILIRDVDAKQLLDDAETLPKRLTQAELLNLPTMIAKPAAVLLEPGPPAKLFYIFNQAHGSTGKIVVTVNVTHKLAGGDKTTFNAVQKASLIDTSDLQKDIAAGKMILLEGKL